MNGFETENAVKSGTQSEILCHCRTQSNFLCGRHAIIAMRPPFHHRRTAAMLQAHRHYEVTKAPANN